MSDWNRRAASMSEKWTTRAAPFVVTVIVARESSVTWTMVSRSSSSSPRTNVQVKGSNTGHIGMSAARLQTGITDLHADGTVRNGRPACVPA